MSAEFLVVEYTFNPPATDADFKMADQKLGPCLEERSCEWVHSYVSADRKRRFCVFKAADADTLRQAYRSAGVGFEKIWNGVRLAP